MFETFEHVFNSEPKNKLTTYLWLKDTLSCSKQLPSNFPTIFALWIKVNFGARLQSNVSGGLILSSYNPLHFHAKTLLLPAGVVRLQKWLKSCGFVITKVTFTNTMTWI